MNKVAKLYKTSRPVMIVSFVIEGALSYGFASLAIDRGNLWWYILTLVFLVRAIKDLIRFIGSFIPHGQKAA